MICCPPSSARICVPSWEALIGEFIISTCVTPGALASGLFLLLFLTRSITPHPTSASSLYPLHHSVPLIFRKLYFSSLLFPSFSPCEAVSPSVFGFLMVAKVWEHLCICSPWLRLFCMRSMNLGRCVLFL